MSTPTFLKGSCYPKPFTAELRIDSPLLSAIQNLGTGAEIYAGLTGSTANLRSLTAGSNITLTQNANDIVIDASGGGSPCDANNNLIYSDNAVLTGSNNAELTCTPAYTRSTVESVTIGSFSTPPSDQNRCVKIGRNTGTNATGIQQISIGRLAGQNSSGNSTVAIGDLAGFIGQSLEAVALGKDAGQNQGAQALAIGSRSGNSNQGNQSVCIGTESGQANAGVQSVNIGYRASQTSPGVSSVSIGAVISNTFLGSVVIGRLGNSSATNQIVLNSTNTTLTPPASAGFFVSTIATTTGPVNDQLVFNNTTKEIQRIPSGQCQIEVLASDPTAYTGRMYYNTTANQMRVYDGATWQVV